MSGQLCSSGVFLPVTSPAPVTQCHRSSGSAACRLSTSLVTARLPASTLAPLLRVQNATARLLAGLGPRDHVTPALKAFHWVFQRIQYKLCVLAHAAFYKYGPAYLTELLVPVSELPGRSRLRSADSFKFDVP